MNTNQEAKRTMQMFVNLMEGYSRNKLTTAGEFLKGNEVVEGFLGTFYRGRLGSDLEKASEVIWDRLLTDACAFIETAVEATGAHLSTHKEESLTEIDLRAILMQVALDRAVEAHPTTPEPWQDVVYIMNASIIHGDGDVWERANEVAENVLDLFAQAKRKLGDLDGEPERTAENTFGFDGPFIYPGDFDGDSLRVEIVKNRFSGNVNATKPIIMKGVSITRPDQLDEMEETLRRKEITMKDGYKPLVADIPADLAKSMGLEPHTEQEVPEEAFHLVHEVGQYMQALVDLIEENGDKLLNTVSADDWVALIESHPDSGERAKHLMRELFPEPELDPFNEAARQLSSFLDREFLQMLKKIEEREANPQDARIKSVGKLEAYAIAQKRSKKARKKSKKASAKKQNRKKKD